ncbi:MAG: Coenzyme F420 hydrogenase/dehydrogenase, beta subunit C-terminal domain [bacterium]|nr:Coenzyme F420 hydrogenase/dehydrogenase, beta subunit C-terminal domain [bacterium]
MAEMTLEKIVAAGLCSGCGACVFAATQGAVEMRLDGDGFLRPVALRALNETEQFSIRQFCPGIALQHPEQFDKGVSYHHVWGPVSRLAAGHAADADVRHKGSSGGALSGLLIHLLETGKIDFVLHTRASETQPLTNESVFSSTRKDVIAAAGSRYAPASPVAALRDALARPGRFAFVGKPCDVAAVRKIVQARPELAERIPYLLSFMCAGTPSMKGTHEILQRFKLNADEVVGFRYRGDGWPGLACAETVGGQRETMDYNTAWGTILNRHLQSRCKMCADGTGEFADVVGADAWHGKDGYPDFAEAEGRSLVLARTGTGSRLVSQAVDAGAIAIEPFPIENLNAIQPYQRRRKQEIRARALAAKIFKRTSPTYIRFKLEDCSAQLSRYKFIKVLVGTAVRIFNNRV